MQSNALLRSVSSAAHHLPLSIFFLHFSIIAINKYCLPKPHGAFDNIVLANSVNTKRHPSKPVFFPTGS